MSSAMYQSQVIQATRKEADFQKKISEQRGKIAKLQAELGAINRSINKQTMGSTLASRMRQIETKTKDLARAEEQLGDLMKRQSSNLADLTRYTQSRDRVEEQEQRRRDAEAQRRHQAELRHVQGVTREMERQRRLHSDMSRSHMVIDLAKLPTKITVLFLAAIPRDLPQIGPDVEIRRIQRELRGTEYRDSLALESRWAVRPSDLLQALNETQPNIVHFSGHGSENGIALHNPDGSTKLVPSELIASTLATVSESLQLVVFNSCFSESQAKAVTDHVPIAVGMSAPIGDLAAEIFAGQFYSSLGFGRSVKKAFDQAIQQLRLEGVREAHIPQLIARGGVDPDEIILVRPPSL